MNSRAKTDDAGIRQRALERGESFLVQAPAGSGKTELLIQRYLGLLATVNEPEEILAVTFTRKAASEMRTRVMRALERASLEDRPTEVHLQKGYELAQQAIRRGVQRQWNLLAHPGRMRIGTLDSVNARLSGLAPLSAGFTSLNRISDDPDSLWREAARRMIGLVEMEGPVGDAVIELLRHVDNRADRLESMFARLLGRRDHWMRKTGAGIHAEEFDLRGQLETNLAVLVENTLREIYAIFPVSMHSSIGEVMSYAGERIAEENPDSPMSVWKNKQNFPDAKITALPLWRSMAATFLTSQGEWRKRLTRTQGFPTDRKDMKDAAMSVIGSLTEIPGMAERLRNAGRLPDPRYPDGQWQALDALLRTLPYLAAELKQVFGEQGATDFTEIGQEALAALGTDDAPSGLGLELDYRISHVLLDEFQDTSQSQYQLLERITAGWEPTDGRTLFLVGDPMQSIYRFREAEVGLYLTARRHGIGSVQLNFLRLESNFRSDPALVDWVNELFSQILPTDEDPISGAVPFAPSRSARSPQQSAEIVWHSVPYGDNQAEADEVLQVVRHCLKHDPSGSIGILVRSRRHAVAITRALREAEIGYRGADMETLEEQSVVQDLLSLTRAVNHTGDRLAWLAVLRAPWCGLTLEDLHALAGVDHARSVPELMGDSAVQQRLSRGGARRMQRCADILTDTAALRGRLPLRDLIELAWLRLGGPATLDHPGDMELVDLFLEAVDKSDAGGDCPDGAELRLRLKDRPVTRAAIDERVQLMTMHKAKGLEFDTVILPGLGYGTRPDEKSFLLWHELADTDHDSPLVIAPMRATGDEEDPIYELLWSFEQRKAALEHDRLFYVATTRAKQRLHLFAQTTCTAEGEITAKKSSLLGRIWPVVRPAVLASAASGNCTVAATPLREKAWCQVRLKRFPSDWRVPSPPASVAFANSTQPDLSLAQIDYEWASRWAMHVGTVVHRWLQEIAEKGSTQFDRSTIEQLEPTFRRSLIQMGVDKNEISLAVRRVCESLTATLEDERGRWILSDAHTECACELPLTVVEANHYHRLILDRTFVCSDDFRWIIDYKISSHTGGSRDEFLASEVVRYRPQLKQYRDAIKERENRPTRTALYFPLMQIMQEVDVDQETDPRV